MRAAVVGVGCALPPAVITNADLCFLDTTDEWIRRRTGIRERRRIAAGQSLAELAVGAGTAALADAGSHGERLTHVVVATTTPDRVTPGVAVELADRLGVDRPAAFDLHAACSGFVYGLDYACAMVESGRADQVLVCGAEALSRIVDPADRTTAVLFGDGAGAAVVAAVADARQSQFSLGSDGSQIGLLYAGPVDRQVRMRGSEVYEYAVRAMATEMRALLTRSGMSVDDLDLFIAHQANARIVRAVAEALQLPSGRLFMNLDRVGNTSAASIPVAMAHARAEARLVAGATVGMTAFGAGVTWGAGVIGYWPGQAT